MHVTDQVDHANSIDSQAQLLSVLNISKISIISTLYHYFRLEL
ncbi:hypothetical protein LINPERHAP2_LOCUS10490 [Linum perenne]